MKLQITVLHSRFVKFTICDILIVILFGITGDWIRMRFQVLVFLICSLFMEMIPNLFICK